MPPCPSVCRISYRPARIVPCSSSNCARRTARVGAPPRGGGEAPSAKVGLSEGEALERGRIVGVSGPNPSGARVGASEGGGRSDELLPGALDGERTAGPASPGGGGTLTCRER